MTFLSRQFWGGSERRAWRRARGLWWLVMGATLAWASPKAAAQGLDSGLSVVELARAVAASPRVLGEGYRWMRVRHLGAPATPAEERAAIAYLHSRGIRLCVLVVGPGAGHSGVRPGPGRIVPLDLREAYAWAMERARSYPGIDAWEIANEPDVGFVPENAENYLALLKACYLGFKRGAALDRAEGRVAAEGATPLPDRAHVPGPWAPAFHKVEALLPRVAAGASVPVTRESRVVMAPLALPPGPYLEQLLAGDLLAYTEGFNFHYYGYAPDFTGVYDQFQRAVADFTRPVARPARALPVFVTEYGYGLLFAATRERVAARVEQWRWFESVEAQIRRRGVEAPMAFYLQPYLEFAANEYGLAARERLDFSGVDFGAKAGAMRALMTETVSGAAPTPALAYLSATARQPYTVKDWSIPAGAASPVVLDLIAGAGAIPMKSYGGYLVRQPRGAEAMTGQLELAVYNLSERPQAGRLVSRGAECSGPPEWSGEIVLAPGERRIFPVTVAVSTEAFRKTPWEVKFVPTAEGRPAVVQASLYPNATNIPRHTYLDLAATTAAESTGHQQALATRPRVPQEIAGTPQGRWLCVGEMAVREEDSTWSFDISALPPDHRRACSAELPLPDGFNFSPELLLSLEYRIKESRTPAAADALGDMVDVCIRTENGNLYEAWPRLLAKSSWQPYLQAGGNFSMIFYGRAALPWRFTDNQPVSLVLFFRPCALPATYEIRQPAIVWHGPETTHTPFLAKRSGP